ncbi:exocyst complex component 6B [Capsaspora owczarzaki ATCC 30864]|uniref:exocyst complex component 6B n=1 Tax=Capsaspora owczarzaki (strain ATCC 30864) TaxID=595528 RepID=UPI00035248A3|nr:exocyst complex component 6B [Capsaspora owczarzaki ATCC 30864]|eukprot:XP_004364698.2 exocyst complex component 6B [Capsaspora owczarzaki ATCC 30864]
MAPSDVPVTAAAGAAATTPIVSELHGSLIGELSAAEGQLAPTLRAVYESNTAQAFMVNLDSFIARTTTEIERMCNHHYQGFIESVEELLKVRADAANLREAIARTDEALQRSGRDYLERAEELRQHRIIHRNIVAAMEALTSCLPALQLYGKAHMHYAAHRYYHALTALTQLETRHLPNISQYTFARVIADGIPVLRASIKTAALSELQDWLASIRQRSRLLGSSVLAQLTEWQRVNGRGGTGTDASALSTSTSTSSTTEMEPLFIAARAVSTEDLAGDGSASSLATDTDGSDNHITVDFTPVYQCMHVYSAFQADAEFEAYYRQARRQQANLLYQPLIDANAAAVANAAVATAVAAPPPPARDTLSFSNPFAAFSSNPFTASPSTASTTTTSTTTATTSSSSSNNSNNPFGSSSAVTPSASLSPSTSVSSSTRNLSNFFELFNEIAGFFIVEETVMTTTQGLVTRGRIDDMWEIAVGHMAAFLSTQSKYTRYAPVLLEAKNYVVLFCHAVAQYGYVTTQLLATLSEMRQRYVELLLIDYSTRFRNIFQEDIYEPIVVSDEREYERWLVMYPQRHGDMDRGNFPASFPFSASVPKIYAEVKDFVKAILTFVNGLELSHTDMDDALRDATNAVLTRTLADALSSLIRQSSLNLRQLLQISVNATSLADTFAQIEHHISSIMHTTAPSAAKNANASAATQAPTNPFTNAPLAAQTAGTGGIQGVVVFKQARSRAEDLVFSMVKAKMDDFIELADYNWLLLAKPTAASGYLEDMLSYLETMFRSVECFPPDLAHLTYFCACNHLAHNLHTFILSDNVKRISAFALEQFELDVVRCESFAMSCPVPQLKDSFLPLRQLVSLFTQWDFEAYMNDSLRGIKYGSLQTARVIKLLEKVRDDDSKFAIKKSSRTKEIDGYLKTLRGNSTAHSPILPEKSS